MFPIFEVKQWIEQVADPTRQRKEPPPPQWLDKAAIIKRYPRWAADFDEIVQRPDFPKASRRAAKGSWNSTLVWTDRNLDRFVEEKRAERDELNRLLGE